MTVAVKASHTDYGTTNFTWLCLLLASIKFYSIKCMQAVASP